MHISRMVGTFAVTGCLILLTDCAGRRGSSPADPVDSDSSIADRSQSKGRGSDRMTLPGQNRTLPSEDPRNRPRGERTEAAFPVVQPTYEPPREEVADVAFPSLPAELMGATRYRVQVFATRLPESARRVRAELAASVGETVYIVEEGGIEKVQVGDERDHDAAGSLLRRLVRLGYQDAFIVESKCR